MKRSMFDLPMREVKGFISNWDDNDLDKIAKREGFTDAKKMAYHWYAGIIGHYAYLFTSGGTNCECYCFDLLLIGPDDFSRLLDAKTMWADRTLLAEIYKDIDGVKGDELKTRVRRHLRSPEYVGLFDDDINIVYGFITTGSDPFSPGDDYTVNVCCADTNNGDNTFRFSALYDVFSSFAKFVSESFNISDYTEQQILRAKVLKGEVDIMKLPEGALTIGQEEYEAMPASKNVSSVLESISNTMAGE